MTLRSLAVSKSSYWRASVPHRWCALDCRRQWQRLGAVQTLVVSEIGQRLVLCAISGGFVLMCRVLALQTRDDVVGALALVGEQQLLSNCNHC